MLFRQALGIVLSEHRYKNKLTLRETISKSQARIAHNYLWELEQGRKEASSEILNELAKCLGTDTADLVMKVGLVMNGYSIPDTAQELFDTASDLVSER